MTNHNPTMSSPSPQDRRRQRDILAKVNAHADRSMDRLFADIEELLGDDRGSSERTAQRPPTTDNYSEQSPTSVYPPESAFSGQRAIAAGRNTEAPDQNPPAKSTKRMPLWLKALMGVGVASIAASSFGFWLVNERKVALPQIDIDTSWLPFQSRVAPNDAKFADYMRKSLAKIEAAPPATTTPAATTPTATTPTATTPTATLFTPTTSIIPPTTTPAALTPTIVTKTATPATNKITLLKTLQSGTHPEAVFQIDGHTHTVRIGHKIGTSNWSLLAVDKKGEVILKRKGGEIRSVYVGQKF